MALTSSAQNVSIRPVTRLFHSDATKIVAYLISCFLLTALMAPWVYNAGMFLAEFTEAGTENSAMDWLGTKAREAEFPRFFKRTLMASAVLLLIPLLFSLRLSNRPPSLKDSPWSLYLPAHAIATPGGQALRNPRFGWLQLITGFLLAAGLLFAMGLVLLSLGWFHWEANIDWVKDIKKSIPAAISASLIEEFLIRGALLGVFLRTFRPFWAITTLAILFAAVHFLQPTDNLAIFEHNGPIPDGMVLIDPESSLAGFELLRLIGLRFLEPLPLLYEFTTLTVIGLILGYARYATSSLWLPIGLHAGWIFSFKLFNRVTDRGDLDSKLDLFVGRDLKEGLIPLATLAITAILVALYTRLLRPPPQPEIHHSEPGTL